MELADQGNEKAPHMPWFPIDGTDTIYRGQVVKTSGDGVAPIGAASGAADTSNKSTILGLVMGNTDDQNNELWDTTFNAKKVTGIVTQADQVARNGKYVGNVGMYRVGDSIPLVQVALLTPSTILTARLYNSTYGTAPSLLTVTTGDAVGLGFTSNATDHTPVADKSTSYFRTGASEGLYRISDDTSTTVETNDVAFKGGIAVGDTAIRVPYRQGLSFAQLDTEAIFLDVSATPATNYYIINVISMNLDIAGEETIDFTFGPVHFDLARA